MQGPKGLIRVQGSKGSIKSPRVQGSKGPCCKGPRSKGPGVQGYKFPKVQLRGQWAKAPRVYKGPRVQGPKGPREIGSQLKGENKGISVPHVWDFFFSFCLGGDGAFQPMALS